MFFFQMDPAIDIEEKPYLLGMLFKVLNFIVSLMFIPEIMIWLVGISAPMILVGFCYISAKRRCHFVNICLCGFVLTIGTVIGLSTFFTMRLYNEMQLISDGGEEQMHSHLHALARYYFKNSLHVRGKLKKLISMNCYVHGMCYSQIPVELFQIFEFQKRNIKKNTKTLQSF